MSIRNITGDISSFLSLVSGKGKVNIVTSDAKGEPMLVEKSIGFYINHLMLKFTEILISILAFGCLSFKMFEYINTIDLQSSTITSFLIFSTYFVFVIQYFKQPLQSAFLNWNSIISLGLLIYALNSIV